MIKRRFKIRFFNLIAITMAIAVVGIGIAGIMALFPPAIDANKKADELNFLDSVAENLMAYLEKEVLSNYTNISNLHNYNPEPPQRTAAWNNATKVPGIYKKVVPDSDPNSNYVFGIESSDGRVNGYVAIWSPGDPVPNMPVPATNSRRVYVELSWPATIPYWADPVNKTKKLRNTKLYVFDIFKPQ